MGIEAGIQSEVFQNLNNYLIDNGSSQSDAEVTTEAVRTFSQSVRNLLDGDTKIGVVGLGLHTGGGTRVMLHLLWPRPISVNGLLGSIEESRRANNINAMHYNLIGRKIDRRNLSVYIDYVVSEDPNYPFLEAMQEDYQEQDQTVIGIIDVTTPANS